MHWTYNPLLNASSWSGFRFVKVISICGVRKAAESSGVKSLPGNTLDKMRVLKLSKTVVGDFGSTYEYTRRVR